MKISDIMTRDVETVTPERSIREVAASMEKEDCGAIFVREGDKLVGVVTDRDITIRAVAKGLDGNTPVGQVMTDEIRYCFEDEDVQHVAENMADLQVRRLPVMDRSKRLVGIVSLGNFASSTNTAAGDKLLRGVAQAH